MPSAANTTVAATRHTVGITVGPSESANCQSAYSNQLATCSPDRRLARPHALDVVLPAADHVGEIAPRRRISLIDRRIVTRAHQQEQQRRERHDDRQEDRRGGRNPSSSTPGPDGARDHEGDASTRPSAADSRLSPIAQTATPASAMPACQSRVPSGRCGGQIDGDRRRDERAHMQRNRQREKIRRQHEPARFVGSSERVRGHDRGDGQHERRGVDLRLGRVLPDRRHRTGRDRRRARRRARRTFAQSTAR